MDQHDHHNIVVSANSSGVASNNTSSSLATIVETPQHNEVETVIHEDGIGSSRSSTLSGVDPELPPQPVTSPPEDNSSATSLQLIVEQLYGRCQVLERERDRTHGDNTGSLGVGEGVLGRRIGSRTGHGATQNNGTMLHMQQQNRSDQVRLFHNLCRQCQTGFMNQTQQQQQQEEGTTTTTTTME